MKRFFILSTMLLLMSGVFAQVLVNETFESGNTVGQSPVGWICSDNGWKAGITIPDDNEARGRKPHSGEWYMYASYNTDVWIYKELNVTAGAYYRVSFWYATWHVDHFNLEVKAGASASPSAMTVTVVPDMVVENEEYEQTSAVFQAPSSGSFYVGFHSMATNMPWYLSIDDVIIEQTSQYNFTLEQLTADTSAYFGEPAYLRFVLHNIGEQSDTYQFTNTGTLPIEFYMNGTQVSQVNLPYNSSAELIAKATLPMNLIDGETLHATFDVASSHSAPIQSADFTITALQPFNNYPLEEGFENDFPPFGWQNRAVNGNYYFERYSEGEWPMCSPHDESQFMARYHSYSSHEGNTAELVSPKMALSATGNMVSFWLFRNSNPNINRPDRINVYYNTEPCAEGGTLLGTVHRCTYMDPVVADVDDWYEYSYNFNSPTGYGFIIFEAVSGYGWNLFIDDIMINNDSEDDDPPTLVSVKGNQQYADTDMMLLMRVHDASSMPSTLNATYTINGSTHALTFTQSKSNYDYTASIPAQVNHTSGQVTVTLVDDLGNTGEVSFEIHWDYQRPLLYETFDECESMSLPEGWTTSGNPTWFDWYVLGTTYYTDYYGNEFVVSPHSGNKQAILEWDDTEEPMGQDQTMISPVISITEPTVLTFWTWIQYGTTDTYDHFVVRVYDCYDGTWNDKWDAANLPAGQINSYTEPISIPLDSYMGNNIKIGFRGYNTFGEWLGFDWFVDDVKVIVTDTTEVAVGESFLDDAVMSLYPNPAADQIHIDSKSKIRSVEIASINGAVVENKKVDCYRLDWPLEGYSKGVYFVRLVTDEGMVVRKLVLK